MGFGVSSDNQQPKTELRHVGDRWLTTEVLSNGEEWATIDGKRVNLKDPAFLAAQQALEDKNKAWQRLDESFEERKEFHTNWYNEWTAKYNAARETFTNAVETYTNAFKEYTKILGGRELTDLQGSDKTKAQELSCTMSKATSTKSLSDSMSIFYLQMAADETASINDYCNLQTIAKHMQG